MVFIKTFKGYEDKVGHLDAAVNEWLQKNRVDLITLKSQLSHEPGGRAGSGDLIYTLVYRADAPIA